MSLLAFPVLVLAAGPEQGTTSSKNVNTPSDTTKSKTTTLIVGCLVWVLFVFCLLFGFVSFFGAAYQPSSIAGFFIDFGFGVISLEIGFWSFGCDFGPTPLTLAHFFDPNLPAPLEISGVRASFALLLRF